MISRYAGGERGARSAARSGSVLVVVDAFRASTTISLLVSRGARVLPVASIREAAAAKADLRVGERDSAKVSGFDFGNSPNEILASKIPAGSTVAMSTTNGTRVVEAGLGSAEIYTGAFVNAGCLAARLHERFQDAEVVVVGCGWEGRRASEDEAAAGAILHRLELLGSDLDQRARAVTERYLRRANSSLRTNSAARRLLRLGRGDDVELCLREDSIPASPRLLGEAFADDPEKPRTE
ncbi:2-phosphosulfolactate phosphatase family protein [soil metagenome]